MTERGLLFVISGPSGVGKDTILNLFMKKACRCVLSISATTRAPRAGEVSGKDYYFVTREEFETMASNGDMLEYTEYNGNYYGTPKGKVEEILARGDNVILEIEVDGGLQVKNLKPEAVLVFIVAPSLTELERRLRSRGTETEESIKARLDTSLFEISKAHMYDYIIINDVLEHCVDRLAAVITAAGCATKNMKRFIKEVVSNA